ncbi:MAG: fructose-bisphosphate aldolase [Candidatus Pacearchaeota archaeon]|jgi:class I fructose-bisphosphate aldolase
MKKINLKSILKNNKAFFLAYDQGLEHGPIDFNDKNVDPKYIIDIGKKGKYNALIFQKGIAEKYNDEIKASKIPLIIKLNGKTSLVKGEPISRQLCTVAEAIELGAVAVGYTIYVGSEHESEMMQEFENIVREAHNKGLPVILWAYPRGIGIEGKSKGELLAYSARVGLELGADIIKIHWDSSIDDLKWAVKSAGKTKVVIAGGAKEDTAELLKQVKEIMNAGAIGLAIGRNIWQSDEPLKLTEKLKKVIFR